jgi:hypothetical protein
MSYKFKGSDKLVSKELFKAGSTFPSTKSITFEGKLGGIDLLLHYPSKHPLLLNGLPNQIA